MASFVSSLLGVSQKEFYDPDVNEPLFGGERRPESFLDRIQKAAHRRGSRAVLVCLGLVLGIGLGSIVFLGFTVKGNTGIVRRDTSQQNGDWRKTKTADDRGMVESHIAKQVDTVRKMEKDLEKLQINPPPRWPSNSRDGFLDPSEPVRQYVKYRHDKEKSKWKDSNNFPDMYQNPFENSRTGKQWHDRFGNIVKGKPARYRRLIEQHDEDWPTEPHVHPASGFDVFSKKNIYSIPDSNKPAISSATQSKDVTKANHDTASHGVAKTKHLHESTSAAMQGYIDAIEGDDSSPVDTDGTHSQGVGSIDSLMKIAGAKRIDQIDTSSSTSKGGSR